MEIEVNDMKNDVKRIQDNSTVELEQYHCNYQLEQERNLKLCGQVAVLEEQTTHLMQSLQKLSTILTTMKNERKKHNWRKKFVKMSYTHL